MYPREQYLKEQTYFQPTFGNRPEHEKNKGVLILAE